MKEREREKEGETSWQDSVSKSTAEPSQQSRQSTGRTWLGALNSIRENRANFEGLRGKGGKIWARHGEIAVQVLLVSHFLFPGVQTDGAWVMGGTPDANSVRRMRPAEEEEEEEEEDWNRFDIRIPVMFH